MRVLLDEDDPEQVIGVLRHIARLHEIKHVHELKWTGKKDVHLFRDASTKFDAIITNNYRQLDDPDETVEIKKSGLHHVSYAQRIDGLRGLALAVGAIIAAAPALLDELAIADSQRLAKITGLALTKRYEITDPKRNPPRYWPR